MTQISFVTVIFLLFSDQISGLRGGGQTASGGRPPVEESQLYVAKLSDSSKSFHVPGRNLMHRNGVFLLT